MDKILDSLTDQLSGDFILFFFRQVPSSRLWKRAFREKFISRVRFHGLGRLRNRDRKDGGSNSDNQGAKEINDDIMDFLGMPVGVFADSLGPIARCIRTDCKGLSTASDQSEAEIELSKKSNITVFIHPHHLVFWRSAF